MTIAEDTAVLKELKEFRLENRQEMTALSDRIRSLEDSRLTDGAAARTAAAAAATAASTAAAAAVAVASAASAAAALKNDKALSVRAWALIAIAAVGGAVAAVVQLAGLVRG